jgi:hypothetical protein
VILITWSSIVRFAALTLNWTKTSIDLAKQAYAL